MKRAAFILLVLTLVLGGTAAVVYAEEIEIVVSPNVINLRSHAMWVTIHADIPFSEVVEGSVSLDGISAASIEEDYNGDLVAQFSIRVVKESLGAGYVELTLEGVSTLGDFWGVDIIRVIDTGRKE